MKEIKIIEIIKGKTYKNFAGNYRTLLAINEEAGITKIQYQDGTSLPRICE